MTEEPQFSGEVDILRSRHIAGKIFLPFPDSDDAGQIQLIDVMPRLVPEGLTCDYAIPQMARVSYGIGTKKVNEDRGLIRYLLRHKHTSPFEAIEFKFRIRCPIFVYRQWFRHRSNDQCEVEIISTDEAARKFMSMNEMSARYSIMPDIWYLPTQLRIQSKHNKQGGNVLADEVLNEGATRIIRQIIGSERAAYEELLKYEVSRELARGVLGTAYITEFYWKVNLLNLLGWLSLRADPHAQLEIRVFANYIGSIVRQLCPESFAAFMDYVMCAMTLSASECRLIEQSLVDGNTNWNELQDGLAGERELQESYRNVAISTRELDEFQDKVSNGFVKPLPDFPLINSMRFVKVPDA